MRSLLERFLQDHDTHVWMSTEWEKIVKNELRGDQTFNVQAKTRYDVHGIGYLVSVPCLDTLKAKELAESCLESRHSAMVSRQQGMGLSGRKLSSE